MRDHVEAWSFIFCKGGTNMDAIEQLKQKIADLTKENSSLKNELLMYRSPFAEKYKNMSLIELTNHLSDLTQLSLLETVFVIGVVVPEMMCVQQSIQDMQTELEMSELEKEDIYSDVA